MAIVAYAANSVHQQCCQPAAELGKGAILNCLSMAFSKRARGQEDHWVGEAGAGVG